jgi:CHASE2 domain-containing sensor protein
VDEVVIVYIFAGKTVFVGHSALITTRGRSFHDFSTPYTRWCGGRSPGVEIQATAFLNLVRKDWLTRLPIAVEAGLIIAVGSVFGFGLTLLRSWIVAVVVAIAGVLAVAGSTMAMFWQMHIWFSWLAICAVQIPGALAWFLYAQRDRRLSQKAEALTPSGDYFAA